MVVVTLGVALALAAAVRSTWSPCGLSMLSQITPVAEAGRHHRFARTAAWFVVGAGVGGLCLGAMMAAGAAALAAFGIGDATALGLIVAGAVIGALVDTGALGVAPPFLRRQVNEDWLSRYRPWVYGGGFGWQIGAGVTTYVMTAAIPVLVLLGVVSARPWVALALGGIFGLTRGLAVLLGSGLETPAALYRFHRRFDALKEPVRRAVVAVQLAVAVVAAWVVAPLVVAAGVSVVAVAILAVSFGASSFGVDPTREPVAEIV